MLGSLHRITKIVSGGQTGVDRAALDFALANGICHGGWCPEGRKAEDGVIPIRYQLDELKGAGYRQRTRQNVTESSCTLILNIGEPEGGTKRTIAIARHLNKSFHVAQLDDASLPDQIAMTGDWLEHTDCSILNIAGPRESKHPGVYQMGYDFLGKVLRV
jgi:hypothetical protein